MKKFNVSLFFDALCTVKLQRYQAGLLLLIAIFFKKNLQTPIVLIFSLPDITNTVFSEIFATDDGDGFTEIDLDIMLK